MARTIKLVTPPAGFRYETNFLTEAEEDELVSTISQLPFKEYEFRGYLGRRRIVSFGLEYDINGYTLNRLDDIPDYLVRVRDRAAGFAGVRPAELVHVLVTEYTAGTPIGWHRDRPQFHDVIGVSLLSPCTFRFRRRVSSDVFERHSVELEPRSIYLLSGDARYEWQHSIPPVDQLRYSITFRTMSGRDSFPGASQRAVADPSPAGQLSFDF